MIDRVATDLIVHRVLIVEDDRHEAETLQSRLASRRFAPEIARSDNWWMLGTTLFLFPLLFSGRRINRWEGALLILVYLSYMVILLGR